MDYGKVLAKKRSKHRFIYLSLTILLILLFFLGVKSKLVCNFPRSSVNPLTHPHVNIRVTITVKIPNV